MKKLLVLFLALVLMFSFTACFGNNGAPEDVVAPTDTEQGETPSTGTQTLIDWMKGGEYYFTYTSEVEYEGEKMTSKGSCAVKGDDMAVTTEMTVEGQLMKTRIISADGAVFIINDASKTIIRSPISISEANKDMADFSGLEKVGDGRGTVNGKTLPYEEYTSEGYKIKYYTENGKVYAIESEGAGTKSLMIIENSSETVPSGIFDLPNGYTNLGL